MCVHQIRNTLNYVSYKNRKEFAKDLKKVYAAITEEVALSELSLLEEKLVNQYAIVSEAIGMSYQHTLNILKR
ncbi:transposase, Mutator family protein [Clostridioides difficile CD69]|nr:transposase, Mutator family protein [Clostridioides difficile CD69]